MKTRKEFILIDKEGGSRTLRIPLPVSFLISFLIAVLFASYSCFFILVAGHVSNRIFLSLSTHKFERMQWEFRDMGIFAKSVEGEMDSLFAVDDERREVAGATPITGEVREVGIGGPSTLKDYEEIFLFKDDLERKILDDRIEKLLRQSDLQMYSLSDFEDFFAKKKDLLDRIPALKPAEGSFLSGFGMRDHPVFHIRRMHMGVDISNFVGTPVIASAEGMANTGVSETFGTYVRLNHGNGFSTIYAHLQAVIIGDNQLVRRSQILGYLGNSGLSTGPHLHYEVHLNSVPVDPNPYILPNNFIVD
jgi:murein DD-endopeptidase MepM/ murein hydrolase activator NlpD